MTLLSDYWFGMIYEGHLIGMAQDFLLQVSIVLLKEENDKTLLYLSICKKKMLIARVVLNHLYFSLFFLSVSSVFIDFLYSGTILAMQLNEIVSRRRWSERRSRRCGIFLTSLL